MTDEQLLQELDRIYSKTRKRYKRGEDIDLTWDYLTKMMPVLTPHLTIIEQRNLLEVLPEMLNVIIWRGSKVKRQTIRQVVTLIRGRL